LPARPTPKQKVEQTAIRWARHFAAGRASCTYEVQPLCERIACERVGHRPIPNCTPPSQAYRESFRHATVKESAIKGRAAAVRLSNGVTIELFPADRSDLAGVWWVEKIGGSAGRGLFR
jgi:hypothetical protein